MTPSTTKEWNIQEMEAWAEVCWSCQPYLHWHWICTIMQDVGNISISISMCITGKLSEQEKTSPAHSIQPSRCFCASGKQLLYSLNCNKIYGWEEITSEQWNLLSWFAASQFALIHQLQEATQMNIYKPSSLQKLRNTHGLSAWRTGNPPHRRATGRACWERKCLL